MSGSGFGNVPKRVGFGCLMQLLILVIGIVVSIHMANVREVAD